VTGAVKETFALPEPTAESIKDATEVFFGDSRTVNADAHDDPLLVGIGLHCDVCSARRKADRIVENVLEHLEQSIF